MATKSLPRRAGPKKANGASRAAIYEELDCLGELVQVLGATGASREGLPLDKSLYWVGESLKRLGQRVMALEPR